LGVPVYHHDKFFNPAASMEINSTLRYGTRNDLCFVKHDVVYSAHRELFPAETFSHLP
jgi:hypothetical protein